MLLNDRDINIIVKPSSFQTFLHLQLFCNFFPLILKNKQIFYLYECVSLSAKSCPSYNTPCPVYDKIMLPVMLYNSSSTSLLLFPTLTRVCISFSPCGAELLRGDGVHNIHIALCCNNAVTRSRPPLLLVEC